MFNRKQRTWSLLLILVLLINFGLGGILGIAADQETFAQEKYLIDFCDYNFKPLTVDGYAQFKKDNPSGTPTAGNMYDVNIYNGDKVGTYSLIDDGTSEGSRYLNYVKDSAGKNGGLYSYMFVANPTGNFVTADSDKHIVLKEGATYGIKIRYKISDLTAGYDINLFAFASSGVATPNNVSNWQDRVNIALKLQNTDGWTEAEYTFSMPQNYTGKAPHSLMLGFEPRLSSTAKRPGDGNEFTYNLSVDYIEINRLSEVRINKIGKSGITDTQKLYGIPGEKIQFPDTGTVIYENYNASTGEFSGVVDTANRLFSNLINENFYYKDDTFEKQSYNIDFSRYNFVEGTSGSDGNVVKSNSGKWSLVSDENAVGGKYLLFEKSAVKSGENWKPYYHFMANPTGAYNGATSSGALRLTENTRYTIKIKYKIENLDASYDLDLYANCTQGVYSPNSFHADNNIDIKNGLGNTDGWVEKEYSFLTPAAYKGKVNNLIIGFYPTKAGTASFPMNDEFSYSVAVDYLKIDRATSVVFMSDGKIIDTVYGAPGDTLADFPTALKNGYKFSGWFTNPECSVSAEAVSLTNRDVSATLFAGWSELTTYAVITDDKYPDWRDNTDIFSAFTSERDGDMLCFGYNIGGGKTAYMLLNSDTEPLIIADKGVYMLTVKYKTQNGSADIGFVTSNADKYETNHKTVQINKTVKSDGEWQTAILTFTADIKNNADSLYFTVSSNGNSDILIESITLSVNSYIKLETNGGVPIADLKGTPGETALLPNPVFSGHIFSGWYKDSDLKIPATVVKFPNETESITLYAAWDKVQPDAVVDFENVPYENGKWSNPRFSYNAETMTFPSGDAFSGEKFLKFNYAKGIGSVPYNQAAQSFAMYKNEQPVRLESGSTYIMSFWYRAVSIATDVRITAQTCTANNFYANALNYTAGGYTVRTSESDSEWHEGTVVFTANPKTDSKGNLANAMFVRINPLADENVNLDIDYVSLTKVGADTAVVSLVVDSNETQFVTVKNGNKITLPVPVRDNYIFRGWYEDSLFSKKISGKYTAKGSTELYAKWSLKSAFNDFENYPESWVNHRENDGSNYRFGNSHMSVSANESFSGSYSLRFKYDGTQNKNNSMAQLYNTEDIFVAGDTPLILENGSLYMATLRYKVNNTVGTSNIDLALAGRKNYWANRSRINLFAVSLNDMGKGWQTATVCFTANTKKENADALYLAFTANGKSADIYIDDFEIKLLENKTYVKFDSDNNTLPFYSIGEPGTPVNYPQTPVRSGYVFSGWYTDKSYKTPFTGKNHGNTSLTVYARWVLGDSVLISFEDENQRNLKPNQYDTAEISDEAASHGRYSLKINKSGNTRMNASMLLLYDNQPVTVEDGATYVLTYDYRVVQNTGKGSGQTTPLPNVRFAKADNVWAGYSVPKNNWSINLEEETGKWFTGSVMFTAELKEPIGNALYFTVNYSENFVGYFDNLRLVRVNKGNGESAVNLNPCGADYIGASKLVYTGKPNEQIKLPKDIKKSGFVFIGWYEDSKLKKRIESEYYTILQSDTTLYAGFARPRLIQDFESFKDIYSPETYRYADMDYELYDARLNADGSSNVHGGNYSVHRKGGDFHTAAFQVLPETSESTKRLIPGLVYRMTMWVKLESKKQDTGAVKIACSQSAYYSWAIDGDWYNVAAIKDLKEGEWTELSFTFYATSYYVSVQTPGNVSMYFDDVTLELLSDAKSSDCSQSIKIDEYVPTLAENGSSLQNGNIDKSLVKETDAAETALSAAEKAAIISAAAVIALGGVITAFAVAKKRKKVKKQ